GSRPVCGWHHSINTCAGPAFIGCSLTAKMAVVVPLRKYLLSYWNRNLLMKKRSKPLSQTLRETREARERKRLERGWWSIPNPRKALEMGLSTEEPMDDRAVMAAMMSFHAKMSTEEAEK